MVPLCELNRLIERIRLRRARMATLDDERRHQPRLYAIGPVKRATLGGRYDVDYERWQGTIDQMRLFRP